MPTGYTIDIKNGIDFRTFALNCAREFGACVTIRDAPGGGEAIPDKFEASDYNVTRIAESRSRMAALAKMSSAECNAEADAEYAKACAERELGLREIAGLRAKYEAMLAKVRAWTPPTEDHRGLRDFMASQLEESIRFDCGTSYYETPPTRYSGEVWRARRMASLTQDIEYRHAELVVEKRRANERTEWIAALRASLATEPTP